MVDFRYHVVSIVAVFLALGIGIVFGTTAINRAILNDLDRNVSRLTTEKRDLDTRNRDLTDRASDADAWGEAVAPSLINGVLLGETVVVVSAPGASRDVRDEVVEKLTAAGARVTGRVRLSEELADPSRGAELDDLVVRELPAGLTLPGTGATAAQRAMAEIAYVVALDATAPVPAAPPPATTRVLAGLRERGFLAVDGGPVTPARNVVVVLPGAPPSPTPTPSPTATARPVGLELVAALAGLPRRPVVVAVAPTGGSVAGTQLETVRADDVLKENVSSVDDVDTIFGQTALVLALRAARAGDVGHYGNGVGADAPVPTPAPAPTP
ncbi:MAG TPA: copper transporter [Frankiaceae bacterium]|nr:copper transporter [Frankiaceae bacterium]